MGCVASLYDGCWSTHFWDGTPVHSVRTRGFPGINSIHFLCKVFRIVFSCNDITKQVYISFSHLRMIKLPRGICHTRECRDTGKRYRLHQYGGGVLYINLYTGRNLKSDIQGRCYVNTLQGLLRKLKVDKIKILYGSQLSQ